MTPFSPAPKSTVISVSGTTARAKISDSRGVQQLRFHNDVAATVWIAWGDKNVTANTTSCLSIPAGAVEVLTFESPYDDSLYVTAISASTTGNLNVTPGAGI